MSGYIKDFLIANSSKRKLKSHEINSLKNELFIYWNESISEDVEQFWIKLKQLSIPFERKDPLKYALINNKFRRVDQGMGARNCWTAIKEMNSITERFTKSEIAQIDQIISDDEKNRLSILSKALAKKRILSSQYLKFGECMAYFESCKLLSFTSTKMKKMSFFEYGKIINLKFEPCRSYFSPSNPKTTRIVIRSRETSNRELTPNHPFKSSLPKNFHSLRLLLSPSF